jgi:predicted enzyme related to lactoylglutathione lyase
MPRVIHFELHADDPDRAIRFYNTLFGWHFTKWEGPMDYWLIRTGPKEQPGIDGGMIRRHGNSVGDKVIAYVCTVDTPNLDEYLLGAVAHGGIIVVPKMPIPGVGWLGYAKDPEGNIFGMMQPDPAAR